MATVEFLMQRVQSRLSMLAGQGTQLIMEQSILEQLQTAHNTYILKRWWPQLMTWVDWTLDGATGVVTADVSLADPPLLKYVDIEFVIPENFKNPLPLLPGHLPPNRITGTTPKFLTPSTIPTKLFKVVPATSTGLVSVRYRKRPVDWQMVTEVFLDEDLLVAAASFMYLVQDGTNPDATAVAGRMVEDRLGELDMADAALIAVDEGAYLADIYQWH